MNANHIKMMPSLDVALYNIMLISPLHQIIRTSIYKGSQGKKLLTWG